VSKDQKLQMLRRQLKRSSLEKDAALEEVAAYEKKDRAFLLQRRQVERALARVEELERDIESRRRREATMKGALGGAEADAASAREENSRCDVFRAFWSFGLWP
jgi:hypothetical protein